MGRVEVGEAVFWVFWCWFVGCLVVEGVVLALGVWVFGLKVMADSGIASNNNSNNNKSQHIKGNHTCYAEHIQKPAQVNGWISTDLQYTETDLILTTFC